MMNNNRQLVRLALTERDCERERHWRDIRTSLWVSLEEDNSVGGGVSTECNNRSASDLTFRCSEGTNIAAHSLIVRQVSSVLASVLRRHAKDEWGRFTVVLPHTRAQVVKFWLQLVYTGNLSLVRLQDYNDLRTLIDSLKTFETKLIVKEEEDELVAGVTPAVVTAASKIKVKREGSIGSGTMSAEDERTRPDSASGSILPAAAAAAQILAQHHHNSAASAVAGGQTFPSTLFQVHHPSVSSAGSVQTPVFNVVPMIPPPPYTIASGLCSPQVAPAVSDGTPASSGSGVVKSPPPNRERATEEVEIRCPRCNMLFRHISGLYVHVSNAHFAKELHDRFWPEFKATKQCPICHSSLKSSNFISHIGGKHRMAVMFMSDQDQDFFSKFSKKNAFRVSPHDPVGSKTKRISCPVCNKYFTTMSFMYQHASQTHYRANLKTDYVAILKANNGRCHICGFVVNDSNICTHFGAKHRKIFDYMETSLKEQFLNPWLLNAQLMPEVQLAEGSPEIMGSYG